MYNKVELTSEPNLPPTSPDSNSKAKGLEAAISGFKNFRFSILSPTKPKPRAPTYARGQSSIQYSNTEDDPLPSLQSRPDQTASYPTRTQESGRRLNSTTTLTTLLNENSKWKVVAKKAKVIGKMALQKKNILSTKYGIDESTVEKKTEVEKIRCILPNNLYIIYWDRLIGFLTFYLLTFYIYRVCLHPLEIDALFLVEIVMQGCFLADNVMQFFLAYYEQDELVTDLKTIWTHYLLTYFLFDIVASVPVNVITVLIEFKQGDESHRLLRLLPCFRIFKFMIQFAVYDGWRNMAYFAKKPPMIIRLIKILSLLLYFIHFSACFFVFLARVEDSTETWLYLNDSQDLPPGDMYIFALYWSIQTIVTVGFGDVTLATNLERLMALFLMYLGSAVYSFMISNLNDIAEGASTFETTLKAKINSFRKLTKETNLPKELEHKVKNFIESNHSHNPRTTMHEQNFITELPFTLKAQIMFNINAKVVENVPFFKDKDIDFILRMAPNLKPIELFPKESLFREGEYPEEIYFLTTGALHLKSKSGAALYVVSRGEMFGEIEVLQNIPRITTAQAQSRASLFSFDKERFTELLNSYEEIKNVLAEEAQEKKKRLLDLQKKYKGKTAPGNFIITGSHLRNNAMSADDYVNGMYERPNNRFESLVPTYLAKGVGKKYKEQFVKRLQIQEQKRASVLSETKNFKAPLPFINAVAMNHRRRVSLFLRKQSFDDSGVDISRITRVSPESVVKDEDEQLINEKKKEIETQYFQQAEKLKDELKTTLETLKDSHSRITNQDCNYDKVLRLIKTVEEKQQKINEKLEIYKSLKSEGSTVGSTTETRGIGIF